MFVLIIKIISVSVFLFSLMIISSKINKFYSEKNRYIKVLETVNISKNNSLALVKIGKEGVLLGVSPSNLTKIKELKEDEILKIELEIEKNREEIGKTLDFIKNKKTKEDV